MKFLEFSLTLDLPTELPHEVRIANTLNPHSYCVAKEDQEFYQALIKSDYLIPDGIGVVWATYFLSKKKIKKISGFDLHLYFLNMLKNKGGGKVFYLGASNSTLTLILNRLKKDFPNVEAQVYSPPFKAEFSYEDDREMIDRINKFLPDVLFVGMTAPKQEKWVYKNKALLNTKVACSVGAVFDFYAGTVKRPSKIWIDLGLEWFPRFIKEPKRLWRRNLISTPKFVFDVLIEKFRK